MRHTTAQQFVFALLPSTCGSGATSSQGPHWLLEITWARGTKTWGTWTDKTLKTQQNDVLSAFCLICVLRVASLCWESFFFASKTYQNIKDPTRARLRLHIWGCYLKEGIFLQSAPALVDLETAVLDVADSGTWALLLIPLYSRSHPVRAYARIQNSCTLQTTECYFCLQRYVCLTDSVLSFLKLIYKYRSQRV